uniref:EF-hand domain-containing protein n=1 Tax=Aplanochytrium stocchinoi TaxID=215587 RepID=A0A7S3LT91_9STRA
MGGAVSISEVNEENFQEKLEELWNNEEARPGLKQKVYDAQKFLAKKAREASVGKIEHPLPDSKQEELWNLLDYNGNGFSSLAELDKLVVEHYPEFDNKPAIMRAYHTIDRNNNGFISKSEFADFFYYLDYFCKLWEKFEGIDDNNDRRIDIKEFKQYADSVFGRKMSDGTAETMFRLIDRNGGGKILFYEFAAHFAHLEKNVDVEKLPFE